MENQEQQELMFKLSMYEQQIRQLQQQIQAVEQGLVDISSLNVGLDELVGKEGEEVVAPLGRGIFAKTKLVSEKLLVDVGGGNIVNKSIPEAKKLIEGQIKKLEDVRDELNNNLEKLGEELNKVLGEVQGKEKS